MATTATTSTVYPSGLFANPAVGHKVANKPDGYTVGVVAVVLQGRPTPGKVVTGTGEILWVRRHLQPGDVCLCACSMLLCALETAHLVLVQYQLPFGCTTLSVGQDLLDSQLAVMQTVTKSLVHIGSNMPLTVLATTTWGIH